MVVILNTVLETLRYLSDKYYDAFNPFTADPVKALQFAILV